MDSGHGVGVPSPRHPARGHESGMANVGSMSKSIWTGSMVSHIVTSESGSNLDQAISSSELDVWPSYYVFPSFLESGADVHLDAAKDAWREAIQDVAIGLKAVASRGVICGVPEPVEFVADSVLEVIILIALAHGNEPPYPTSMETPARAITHEARRWRSFAFLPSTDFSRPWPRPQGLAALRS